MGCHLLLQGIFPTQGSSPCLLGLPHWQVDYLSLSHQGSPYILLMLNTGLTKKFVQVFHSITWTTLTRQILCATDNKKQRVLILEGRESAACIPSVNLCFLAVTQDRASGICSLWKSLLVPQPRLIKAQSCTRVKVPRVWKAGRTLTSWLPLGLGHLERG